LAIRASIDLGTNTCLLLIVDIEQQNGELRVLDDISSVVRLGEGIDKSGKFSEKAIDRTLRCLKNYAAICLNHGIELNQVRSVATASARGVTNWQTFRNLVKKDFGFEFEVISGEEEARLSFIGGVLPGMNLDKTLVIDIGGGSTEYSFKDSSLSIDMGSVRFTERYLKSDPVNEADYLECISAVDGELAALAEIKEKIGDFPGGSVSATGEFELLGVAGTATTLAAWVLGLDEYDREKIDRSRLSVMQLGDCVRHLKSMTIEERSLQTGISEKRADVILAGAIILWRSVLKLGFSSVRVSSRGLRYALVSHSSA